MTKFLLIVLLPLSACSLLVDQSEEIPVEQIAFDYFVEEILFQVHESNDTNTIWLDDQYNDGGVFKGYRIYVDDLVEELSLPIEYQHEITFRIDMGINDYPEGMTEELVSFWKNYKHRDSTYIPDFELHVPNNLIISKWKAFNKVQNQRKFLIKVKHHIFSGEKYQVNITAIKPLASDEIEDYEFDIFLDKNKNVISWSQSSSGFTILIPGGYIPNWMRE